MGNSCDCVSRQTDDAEDALLPPEFEGEQPRGPPPPYQPRAPLYAYAQMTDEQRIQLVQRLTLIQCLPCGRYAESKEEKKSQLELEEDTCTGSHYGEKKGDKDRECPICMLDFMVGQPIRLLPCMHYYHMRCIDDWLMRSLTCPTCMERVDVGVKNTVISSHQTLRRRRRTDSSSSTLSTVSSTSSSSLEQSLTCGRSGGGQQVSPTGSAGGYFRFGHQHGPQLQLRASSPGQRQWNQNEIQSHSRSPLHSTTNQLVLNLDQVNSHNINSSAVVGGVSPPGSPVQIVARGQGGHRRQPTSGTSGRPVPHRSPPSPPLIEYHYEYLPQPSNMTTKS